MPIKNQWGYFTVWIHELSFKRYLMHFDNLSEVAQFFNFT